MASFVLKSVALAGALATWASAADAMDIVPTPERGASCTRACCVKRPMSCRPLAFVARRATGSMLQSVKMPRDTGRGR